MFTIFEKLGGKDEAIKIISRRLNWTPSKPTLKKWRAQRSISPRASFALIAECEDRGIPYSQSDFKFTERAEAA